MEVPKKVWGRKQRGLLATRRDVEEKKVTATHPREGMRTWNGKPEWP